MRSLEWRRHLLSPFRSFSGSDSHEIRSGAEEEEQKEAEKEDNNAVRPLRSLPWLPLAAACDATQPLWKSNCLLPIPTFPPSLSSFPSLLPTLATLGRAAESRNLCRNSPGPRRGCFPFRFMMMPSAVLPRSLSPDSPPPSIRPIRRMQHRCRRRKAVFRIRRLLLLLLH